VPLLPCPTHLLANSLPERGLTGRFPGRRDPHYNETLNTGPSTDMPEPRKKGTVHAISLLRDPDLAASLASYIKATRHFDLPDDGVA
jgi:hypothetical protein